MANYDVGDALSRIENILLDSISRNMKRHISEESDLQKSWSMWQTEQLAGLGKWSAKNYRQFAPQFTKINNAAMQMLMNANQNGELDEEIRILQTGIQNARRFFDVPNSKLDALLTAVRSDLSKAEHSILRKADDAYREALFDSHFYLQSGTGTLNQAIDMAVNDLHQRGLPGITYRNGRRVEASVYARMALRTANERAQLLGEGRARDKSGIHTVIVPVSGIACEKCVPWMGKVLVDDVYSSGTASEAAELHLPLLSDAIKSGLIHPNCNCSPQSYFPGQPVPEITQAIRDEAVRKYQLTQKQRYFERQIRKWKRAEKSAPDPAKKKSASARRKEWQKRCKDLCDANHDFLRRDYQREKIYDYQTPPITPNTIVKPTPPEPVPELPVTKPVVPETSEQMKNIISQNIAENFESENELPKPFEFVWEKIKSFLLDKSGKSDIIKAEEIENALKSLGFSSVDESFFENVDKELQVLITNQLRSLEVKYKAIHRSLSPSIRADLQTKSNAATQKVKSNPLKQRLNFSAFRFKIKSDVIAKKKKAVSDFWNMPCTTDDETLSVYTATHEYGHMLENVLISSELKGNPENFDVIAKRYRTEITDIARLFDVYYSEEKYLSKYGHKNDREFFAEVFANSQLGKPNLLGQAMLIWFERREF